MTNVLPNPSGLSSAGTVAREMLSEPVCVTDSFITGHIPPEQADEMGNIRLTFFAKRQSLYGGGDEFTVEARLVMSPATACSLARTLGTMFTEKVRNSH